jgi:hypothetical protein
MLGEQPGSLPEPFSHGAAAALTGNVARLNYVRVGGKVPSTEMMDKFTGETNGDASVVLSQKSAQPTQSP